MIASRIELSFTSLADGIDPKNKDAYEKFKERYRDDPAAFILDCIEWGENEAPTSYQLEIARAVVEKQRVSVRGGRGLGKTTLLSLLILWFALTRDGEDWKIILTASKWHQLKSYLWPEIKKWARRLRFDVIGRVAFTRNELTKMQLELETGATSTSSPGEAGSIEGAHAERIFFAFDESKNVVDDVFDSAEGTFSGAGADTGREAIVLAFSTPGPPSGRFSEIHHRKRGLENWWARHVTLEETMAAGRVSGEWAEQMAKLWGRTSALYKNHVLGEFAAGATNAVIPLAWVEDAVARWHEFYAYDEEREIVEAEQGVRPGKLIRIGLDVGDGGDDTTLALRFGRVIREVRANKEADHEIIGSWCLNYRRLYNEGVTVVPDVVGVGSNLHRWLRKRMNSEPFHAGMRTDMLEAGGEFGFPDKRSAAWWNMRELLNPASGEEIALPPDETLMGELVAPTYWEVAGAKIQVEPKKDLKKATRLGRSTNHADAVIQAFWREREDGRRKQSPKGRTYSKRRSSGSGRSRRSRAA